MPVMTATEARAALYSLLDDVAASHEPVLITGKRNNAVLIAEEDWRAISETLFLLGIPGMRESIVEGMQNPSPNVPTRLSGDVARRFHGTGPERRQTSLRAWPAPQG